MSSMNQISISGNLTRDPELRTIPSGASVCKFSVAVNGFKDDEVHYIDCEAWEKTAESVARYLAKGSLVGVEGELKQDRWEQDGGKRSKISVRARKVTFLGGAKPDRESVAIGVGAEEDIPF